MDAWVVAVVMGLGLTYAQQLSPDRAGLASGTFGSSYGVAIINAKNKGRIPPGYVLVTDEATGCYSAVQQEQSA